VIMLTRILALVVAAACTAPLAAQGTAKGADPAKVLRTTIIIAETGFDPQASQDLYSNVINSAIFEALYEYDYLARPHKIIPRVADGMPEVSADGLTWTIKVRKGIFFSDDPAFKGKPRELTAHDFVYSWKRLVDPKVRSPNLFVVRGKFVGLDAAGAQAKDTKFDYDAPIEGLRALDRYTIQMRFVEPEYTFLPFLTATQLAAVAREVIDAYGDASGWAMANPVGTGAYRLKEWRRAQKITLEANPGYREDFFPATLPPHADAAARAAHALMKGKRMPQIGRIEVSVIEESNPRLLAFTSHELDLIDVPRDLARQVLDERNALLPPFTKAGVALQRSPEAGLAFFAYFNFNDPVVGGNAPEKIALRRAILMGYNAAELVQVGLQGQGTPATQPIPPEVPGHVAGVKSSTPFDPALARQLLDKFGYKDRDGDGFRELPDGKPLLLTMGSAPTGENRIRDELWLKNMKEIGIRIDFLRQKWPDLLKMSRAGQLQMWQLGWTANVAESFMQLAYGPNAGETNMGRFRNAEYDDLFNQSRRVKNDAERDKLYAKMTGIIAAYAPIGGGIYRIENTIAQPWVQGYKKSAFSQQGWRYLDIDTSKLKRP